MAWSSLFKWIKIQRMQVFWREDEPDCLLRVNLFVSKLWFLHNFNNRDKPFATHRLFTQAFHLLFCISEIQYCGDCFRWNILFDKTTVTISSTVIVPSWRLENRAWSWMKYFLMVTTSLSRVIFPTRIAYMLSLLIFKNVRWLAFPAERYLADVRQVFTGKYESNMSGAWKIY